MRMDGQRRCAYAGIITRRLHMDWRDHITGTPEILTGKPTVRGTRLSVEFILGLYGEGWATAQILENYPSLTEDSIQAVFAYASEVMREDRLVYPLPSAT